jgi:sugar transferase EpsL
MRSLLLKRVLDVSVAGAGLLVAMPVMAVVALLIWRKMGSPVLFRQQRPGLHAQPFTLLKFRTMTQATGSDGKPLPDEQRLTPLGKFLRSTSLDELPQLFNVLKGEMSLVGPRPLLMEYLTRYSPAQARRHERKPGITGWAQVSGRNALTWEEKFALDTWYVEHWSNGLDILILWRTLLAVLKREGISGEGTATMTEFQGSKTEES